MSNVIIAGAINMDFVGTSDRLPIPGECIMGTALTVHPGGKASNEAVAAARAGATTRLLGNIGFDQFGDELVRFLAESGVDISAVRRAPKIATGSALIMVGAAGENMIMIIPGANGVGAASDFDNLEAERGDFFVAQFESPLSAVEAFLARGRKLGARNVLNPSPTARTIGQLFALADILIFNSIEFAFYTGYLLGPQSPDADCISGCAQIRCRADQAIVVTLGPAGAIALEGDAIFRIPGRQVHAVDTTGAGDCFVGTLTARLSKGDTLPAAMAYANVAASICVQRLGAGSSMPSRVEIEAELGDPTTR